MNTNKILSIVAYCLVVSLWSEAKCMDNQPDILDSATVNRTTNSAPQNTLGTENEKEKFNHNEISLRTDNHNELNVETPNIYKNQYDRRINKTKVFTYMVAIGVVAWGIYSYCYPVTMDKEYLCESDDYRNWFEDTCKWLGGTTYFDDCGLPGSLNGNRIFWHEWPCRLTCVCSFENPWWMHGVWRFELDNNGIGEATN